MSDPGHMMNTDMNISLPTIPSSRRRNDNRYYMIIAEYGLFTTGHRQRSMPIKVYFYSLYLDTYFKANTSNAFVRLDRHEHIVIALLAFCI